MTQTIAVAGTQPHIGTTTQALQLLQYLQLMGNKVCFVEMNDSKYLKNMKKSIEELKEIEPGHFMLERIELYEQQHIKGLSRRDYDYLIKDYGNFPGADFNKASFMEQDIKIFVAGLKPNEVFYTYDVLCRQEFDDVSFLISFIDSVPDVRAARKAMFDYTDGRKQYNRSGKVFFANYTPEPYEYIGISNKLYSDILNLTER